MQLTLTALNNVCQFFGSSAYVMFSATTPNGDTIEIGITENSLNRVGADILSPDSLIGCKITTKEYVDNRTGEIVNVDDRIESNVLAGKGVTLLNSLNHVLTFSELFKAQRFEANAAINGRVKAEREREKRMIQMQKQMERLALKTQTLAVADAPIDEAPLVEETPTQELSIEEEAF
jgi:hypothetical protein